MRAFEPIRAVLNPEGADVELGKGHSIVTRSGTEYERGTVDAAYGQAFADAYTRLLKACPRAERRQAAHRGGPAPPVPVMV